MEKKLYRSDSNKFLCGVLGGIGEYFEIDPTLVRIGYTFMSFMFVGIPGLIFYVIMAMLVPKRKDF